MSKNEFEMHILGRTIEHLGTQMYKHRAPSVAELIANCWDAGAKNVWVIIPDENEYDMESSIISVLDDGEGMDRGAIQNNYLVVGRNRREDGGDEAHGRKVMGRKGIGKLAGFGLASKVTVSSWTATEEKAIRFAMPLSQLKKKAGAAHRIVFPWSKVDKRDGWPASGTMIELSDLRHTSPIDIQGLQETLSRRFSTVARGEMQVHINGIPLPEPSLESVYTFPKNGYETHVLPSGKEIFYKYSFAKQPIRSKELQGFAVYAHGRTAQAPPFFFNVESTASSQHSTRYVFGEIVADFLDEGDDTESDVISTDRQEIDWENTELDELRDWGQTLTRRVLRECAEKKGEELQNWVLAEPAFSDRIVELDEGSQRQISAFLKVLGQKSERDDQRTRELANSLIRAYEFRTFHDVVDEITAASVDPDQLDIILGRLHDWKVLESRAILEIVSGRLSIIDKLQSMILHNAPETASKSTHDNLHDLLAQYPWLFNPEWQVFAEEKSIGKQLREWGRADCADDMKSKRVDFLALAKDAELIIIELKRPGHAVHYHEVERLQRYQVELMKVYPNCRCVLIYGGTVNIPQKKWSTICGDEDFIPMQWSEMFQAAKKFYQHYQAVLKGDVGDSSFKAKEKEVKRTRQVIETGLSHRNADERRSGLGDSSS